MDEKSFGHIYSRYMDRVIKFSDLEAAVAAAFDAAKSLHGGVLDFRNKAADTKQFGISVCLTDGTLINKGDTDAPFCMGALCKVPLAAVLLSQNTPDEILKKAGAGGCCCHKGDKPKVDVPVMGVRAISMVEPTGDPEGKMTVISDMLEALAAAAPSFSDSAYKAQKEVIASEGVEDKLAQAGFYLYDTAPIALDTFSRLESMQYTTAQLATLGATVAADGRNVVTGVSAFDGANAQHIVGMMAAHGPHHMAKMWLFRYGVPAKSGWGGGVLAILPGVMAVAAYAPELDQTGVSVKASAAVEHLISALDLNVFASAKVRIEK